MKDPNWKKCVLHGNSRDVIKRIPANSIDFILTDPPYNISKHSTGNIHISGRTTTSATGTGQTSIRKNGPTSLSEFSSQQGIYSYSHHTTK